MLETVTNHLPTNEFIASISTHKPKEIIFEELAECIRNSEEEPITVEESRQIASSFIRCCQRVVEIQARIDDEQSKTEQPRQ